MLDFNSNPQIFPDMFASIPTPDAIVPHIEARAYWDNQTIEVRLQAAHDSELDWGKYKLHWELNKASGIEGIGVGKGSALVAPVRSARVPMPRVESAQLLPLMLRLVDAAGYELTNRSNHLLVLPSCAAQARYNDNIAVITSSGHEAAIIQQLNYSVEDRLSERTQVVVTDSPDDEILAWVYSGGRLLFVNENDYAVFWQYGRTKSSEDQWITSTSWLRPDVYHNLRIDDPLSLPFQRVMPHRSIGGLPQDDPNVQRDFLAGRISGWVQRPSIHTVQFGYGRGTVITTTYTLLKSLRFGDTDPVGVVMLNDLIDYLASDACKPVLRAKV